MTAAKPFTITIVGAENSGKTSLAIFLARYFNCTWVPEYAREYLPKLDRPYEEKDLDTIASGQWEWIDAVLKNKSTASNLFQHVKSQIDSNIEVRRNLLTDLLSLLEAKSENLQEMVVIDGGLLNIKLWAQIKYGRVSDIVQSYMEKDPTELYILCRPGKDWTEDPWREAPLVLDRAWIYNQYLRELVMIRKDFFIISLMP